MEWISIKDRLPDERDIYLVYSDGQIALGDFVLEEQIWNVQPYCNSWYWSKSMVTHWMPLPEPPTKSWAACIGDARDGTTISITVDVSDNSLPLSEIENRVHRIFERTMTVVGKEWNDDG